MIENRINLACRRSQECPGDIYAQTVAHSPMQAANIDASEQSEFAADCEGWNGSSYDCGSTIQVAMPAHRWEYWLSKYNWDVES